MDPLELLAREDPQLGGWARAAGAWSGGAHRGKAEQVLRGRLLLPTGCRRGRLGASSDGTSSWAVDLTCSPLPPHREGEEPVGAAAAAGLDTGIHGSVAERAAAARAVMLQRDRQDREQLRELRKAQRQERRVSPPRPTAEGAPARLCCLLASWPACRPPGGPALPGALQQLATLPGHRHGHVCRTLA